MSFLGFHLDMRSQDEGSPERRKKVRVRLARSIVARLGTIGAVLIDISESGSRLEHYSPLQTGKRIRLRFEWEKKAISVDCQILSCGVRRFASGEEGLTVYQSRLMFIDVDAESLAILKQMVSAFIGRALAEQVANARGIGPVLERGAMPIFQSGVLTTNVAETIKAAENRHLIPEKILTKEQGFITCRLVRNQWQKKWTRVAEQPEDGFTVRAAEPVDQIDKLCQTYRSADQPGREFIRLLARLSIEGAEKDEREIPPVTEQEAKTEEG